MHGTGADSITYISYKSFVKVVQLRKSNSVDSEVKMRVRTKTQTNTKSLIAKNDFLSFLETSIQ
jgi:hypothetical protein